jgi:hypothetical protein
VSQSVCFIVLAQSGIANLLSLSLTVGINLFCNLRVEESNNFSSKDAAFFAPRLLQWLQECL